MQINANDPPLNCNYVTWPDAGYVNTLVD